MDAEELNRGVDPETSFRSPAVHRAAYPGVPKRAESAHLAGDRFRL
jgi:hypothetical protein